MQRSSHLQGVSSLPLLTPAHVSPPPLHGGHLPCMEGTDMRDGSESGSGFLPTPRMLSTPLDDSIDDMLNSLESCIPLPASACWASATPHEGGAPAGGAASGDRTSSSEASQAATATFAGEQQRRPADIWEVPPQERCSREARGDLGAAGKHVPVDEMPSFAGEAFRGHLIP